MTLATKITLVRMFLIPFMAVAFFINATWSPYAATVIFIVAAYTDYLDGHVARKQNIVSTMGKFLDPIADKVLVFAAYFMLMEFNGDGTYLPQYWFYVGISILVIREFVIAGLRQIAASNGTIIAADKIGKLKTLLQDISIPMMIMTPVFVTFFDAFKYISYVFYALSMIVGLVSGINYVVKNKAVFKS